MNPGVLILSYGGLSPMEVVENILSELKQTKTVETKSFESTDISLYKCDIVTKYYTTSISLIPFDGKYESVPSEIMQETEALIISFDPNDKSIITSLSGINDFVINNDIQLGFLVTRSTSDSTNQITLENLRENANVVFDIVTLAADTEDSQDSSYSEIIEGLKNYVWSNVNISSSHGDPNNAEDLESQLNDFENLLITAQSLRNNSNLSREEILNKAEKFAEVMAAILNDNEDYDSD